MEQIYNFNEYSPPILTEAMLHAKLEQQKTKHRTILLALSGALIYWCLIITAIALYPVNAVLSIICISYACIAISGGGVIAFIFSNKRRNFTWQLHQFKYFS